MLKILKRAVCAALCALLFSGCAGSRAGNGTDDISLHISTLPATELESIPIPAPGSAEDVDDFPDAATVAKEMGIGINLGNTMEAYDAAGCEKPSYEWIPVKGINTPHDYETCWGAPVTTQEMIDGIRDAGFDTVRIPVFWGNMMENDGEWQISPEYISRVREIADMCLNDDLYVVINIHHFDEFVIRRHTEEECRKIFNILWTQIAEYFKDYPHRLVFEGYNEYLGGAQFNTDGELKDIPRADAYSMTNSLNQTFVDAVRSTGANNAARVLIASGYWTNIDLTTADDFVMPQDTAENRLMVSVHYVDNAMFWSNKIGGKAWKDYIDDQIGKLVHAFSEKNIPVFLGETTSRYNNKCFAEDAEYTTSSECLGYVLEKLCENGFVPVLWDTSGNFYSRSTNMIIREDDRNVISRFAS